MRPQMFPARVAGRIMAVVTKPQPSAWRVESTSKRWEGVSPWEAAQGTQSQARVLVEPLTSSPLTCSGHRVPFCETGQHSSSRVSQGLPETLLESTEQVASFSRCSAGGGSESVLLV